MDRTAARLVLPAAVVAGVSYLAADHLALSPAVSLVWKGAGVSLLALYAALSARSPDGWLLCAVMAFGAAGDVLLGAAGFVVGGAAFLVGHLIAIVLYQRNRRPGLGWPAWLAAAALIAATIAAAYLLPADRGGAPGTAVYAAGLSSMAASAWLSRFPRTLVGAGALMFLASDLLIFARAGPLGGAPWLGFAIWSLYFAGQAMVCVGVVRTLAATPADRAKGSAAGRGPDGAGTRVSLERLGTELQVTPWRRGPCGGGWRGTGRPRRRNPAASESRTPARGRPRRSGSCHRGRSRCRSARD